MPRDVSGCPGYRPLGRRPRRDDYGRRRPRAEALKRIREQHFVMEDLADPVTVELVTSTQHKVSLKKVIDWMAHAGGVSPKEIAMKARVREG
jgi:hypothetical protein